LAIRKKVLYVSFTIMLISSFFSYSGFCADTWNKTYPGTSYPSIGFIQTSDGGYALTGWSANAKSGAQNDNNAVSIRLDSLGNTIWSKTYGGTFDDCTNTIIQTKDGGLALLGYTFLNSQKSAIWLVRLDSSGQLLWNKTFSDGFWGNALIETKDGGYAIAGGDIRGFLFIKTDSDGNTQFSTTFGASGFSGNSGSFKGLINSASSIVQTIDSGYILAGTGQSPNNSSNPDAWLIKIDANAQMLWQKDFGGIGDDGAASVVQTGDGGYAFVGQTSSYGAGNSDLWLIKTDSSGNLMWNRTYGGSKMDFGTCLTNTSNDGFALAGATQSHGAGGFDYWLINTDSSGNMTWNKTYGGSRDDSAGVIILTQDNGYALAGYSDSFGDGNKNFWVVKTDENGATNDLSNQIIAPANGTSFLSNGIIIVLLVVAIAVVVAALIITKMKRKKNNSDEIAKVTIKQN
jgi:hypothetical protein